MPFVVLLHNVGTTTMDIFIKCDLFSFVLYIFLKPRNILISKTRNQYVRPGCSYWMSDIGGGKNGLKKVKPNSSSNKNNNRCSLIGEPYTTQDSLITS